MKHIYIILLTLLASAFVACQEQYITYEGDQYIMFSEQEQYVLVQENQDYFSISVATTRAAKQDRTFGVEVIDNGSNAIEGPHYRLLSNCVTIPAGELTGEVRVKGNYDNLMPTDSLGFILKLLVPEEMEWNDVYPDGTQTKVVMYKSCPFDINNFTGWALVTSMFIYNYPGDNISYQRVARCELHPTEENTLIVHDCFYDGYDVRLKFHGDDPEKPLITMEAGQTISDEQSVLGWIVGDDHILATNSPYYDSYYNSCQRFAILWTHVYVENLGEMVGTIGHFYNVPEWLSDEEAEDIRKELHP